MAGDGDDPVRQFAAAREAAAAALGEWAQRVTAATAEALGKLDPAVRAAHPDDMGVCDGRAVMTRQLDDVDVRLCAPCAVAQGVAEMAR